MSLYFSKLTQSFMLNNLSLQNLALIDALELEFCPGFNVISGETGAGKSLSVDALTLLLGERARGDWIKSGASSAEISAGFQVNSTELQALLSDYELDSDYCLLRRVLKREGESRNFVNGVPATLGQLRQIGLLLADIQAQGDHQSLLGKGAALRILDNWGGTSELAQQLRACYSHWRQCQQSLEKLQASSEQSRALQALLEQEVSELAALDLAEGQFEQLESEYKLLSDQQQSEQSCLQAQALLENDAGDGLLAECGRLQQALSSVQKPDIEQLVDQAYTLLGEAKASLRSHLQDLRSSPQRLQELDDVLSRAHHLARKYRCNEKDLAGLLTSKRDQLEQIDASSGNLTQLQQQVAAAEQQYSQLASQLSQQRAQAASRLSSEVKHRLVDLAITGPFSARLEACPPSADGLEAAEFYYSAHADLPQQPLRRIASGGELARVALALQVVIAAANKLPTLVLDEVDVGIGGATASKVGAMLRELSAHSQIICVTHQPQVAACAQQHWRVSKDANAAITVELLQGDKRVEEIARMGGGQRITATNMEAARELLQQAATI